MSIKTSKKVKGATNSNAFRISSAKGVSSSFFTRVVRGELGNCLSRPVSSIILRCSSSEISGWFEGDFVSFAFLRAMMAERK